MSIKFGKPIPPHLSHPQLFVAGVFIGLAVLLVATYFTDRLGTAMFKRGFAKPFYIKGHRIHHSCIYYILPTAYAVIIGLFFLGYIQLQWDSLWMRLADVATLTAAALAVDFIGDKFWPKIRMNVILHHEWVYTVIPAFIFAYVVNIVI